MKKLLLILLFSSLYFSNGFAQLPNGSIAPDWTLTDINGTTHNLYSYLDSNYTVFIYFETVWNSAGWPYHNSGALENLYIDHGPAGFPNVSATTTDDVMVFFIEGDGSNLACLQGLTVGCNATNTQGDWITGTPFPMFLTPTPFPNAVTLDYAIAYWPTIYKICPNKATEEIGQSQIPYSFTSGCYPQTNTPDNNFEAYLEANGMGNGVLGDNSVSTINISSVTNLNIGGENISDLTGIEDFASLQYLDCSNNNLFDLDVSNNTQLSNLQCEANILNTLTFDPALKSLDCFNNQLSSLDLSNNSNLSFLNCSYNNLVWVDLRNGNNQALVNPNFTGNPLLSCLNVDDPPTSDDDWPWDDPWSVYSTTCDPINSWNCVGNDCLGDSTGQGMYTVLGDCQNSCGVSSVLDNNNPVKELIKVIDVLGRHTKQTNETILFYIYDDGTVQKRIIIE